MNDEAPFLRAMEERPDDVIARLVFADWLEERGDPRGELLRLTHVLTQALDVPERAKLEARLHHLVRLGVPAVGPFFTNSIGMRFAWIPAGTFLMGSPLTEKGRFFDDEPRHPVVHSKGYYLGVYTVTNAQWRAVMNSGYVQGRDAFPVINASWNSCTAFCRALSELEGRIYRVPTEAEWEYACRAGSGAAYCFGDDPMYLPEFAWYQETELSEVGKLKPNAWGLHDMHGNVWEWCADIYVTPQSTLPLWRSEEKDPHVLRGGSHGNMEWFARNAARRGDMGGVHNCGIRLVLELDRMPAKAAK